MQITFPGWATARGYLDLKSAWVKVTTETHTAEGWARVDVDGTLILTDDNSDSHVFDRDDLNTADIEVS